jgi:phosphoribosylaminoimidazole carboxylase (NCAIR synthetase)
VFGVELFLLQDGRLLLNEVAPRPHNSGATSCEKFLHSPCATVRGILRYCRHAGFTTIHHRSG